jgi:lipopolysaccharide transport protein LptA
MKKPISILFAGCLLLGVMGAAEPEVQPKEKTKTTIQSDYGDFDYKAKKGIFEGNVVVNDAEIKLKSEKMIVYLGEKDNGVNKVEAMGTVEIVHQGKTAYADNAVYNKDTGVILLTPKPGGERPRIKDERGNIVRGNEIVINRNDNTMKAVGRVELEYTPGSGSSSTFFGPKPGAGSVTNITNDSAIQPQAPGR